MASSMNFRPGGAEDDDFDFDDDGFYLGDIEDREIEKPKPFDPVQASSINTVNRGGFAGFGAPKPKSQSLPKKSFKRAADKLTDTNERNLDMGDFQMAIVRGQKPLVKQFIDEGFNVDTLLKIGWTGLMYAASNANPEIVELLLEYGADPNFHKDMYTVLMAACGAAGYKEPDVLNCVNLLLGKGSKVDACDRYHTTALMYAAREGRSSVIRKLVEGGANINSKNNRGWTCLTWAVSKQHRAAVKTLLELKADPRVKHSDGQTVLDMAMEAEDDQMVAILEGRQLDPSVAASNLEGNRGPVENRTTLSKPQQKVSLTTVESSGTTYGELELFLCGLDLSNLVDLFRSQRVEFGTFLQMTEEDLIQMGINQIGVRKKIIDGIHAVHKKEWEKSSLPAVQYNKRMSCAESIAMVANIAKHTKYISNTMGFLQDQLKRNPSILDELQDSTGPKQLHQHTVDTCKNIEVLDSQLKTLKLQLAKILKTGNYAPPDLIQTKTTNKSWRRRLVIAAVLSGGVLSLVLWKREGLAEKCIHLIMPIQ